LPALLLTIVSSRAPWSISASISSFGSPAVPKPPIITVAPSCTSLSASAAEANTLLIMLRMLADHRCAIVADAANIRLLDIRWQSVTW
jgi:hypothetical protein